MAQVKDLVDGSSGDSLTNSGTLTSSGTLAVTGGVTLDGAAGTSGQYLISAGSGNTPTWTTLVTFVSGMIVLWSGSSGTIPAGWLLCDGASGTPDLRNRFVVGATSTYAVGATGGSADAVVVSHNHTATSSVSDPGHNHGMTNGAFPDTFNSTVRSPFNTGFTATGAWSATTGISVSTSVASNGVSGTNANLPPYYALCYIMKA